MKNLVSAGFVLLPLLFCVACGNGGADVNPPVSRNDVGVPENLRDFGSLKIFFGHQSVGANIIAGLEELSGSGKTVAVRETRTPPADVAGYFAHAGIGRNGDPVSKLEDFASLLENGFGDDADVALMKFCYLDVDSDSDPERIFEDYDATMTDLQRRFPETLFVHMTVPLVTIENGPKGLIKRILGRPVRGIDDNYRRNVYNGLLRKKYGGKVFDLAAFESTAPDGTVLTAAKGAERFPVLLPAYASDSGHLNAEAGRMIAAGFVSFVSNLSFPR